MIELAAVALIAKAASDGVSAIDKVFRGFTDFLNAKRPSASRVPEPDLIYVNSPEQKALLAKSQHSGEIYQKLTYAQISKRLSDSDREYIEVLNRSMRNYQMQWNAAYEQRSMASGMEIGRLDAQLEYLAREMAGPLTRVLNFVEKMGLVLDDHYRDTRQVAQEYIKDTGGSSR